MSELKATVDKVREALIHNGLRIMFRIKNHRLDYSIMNRPEPELSGVTDGALATAMVHAGNLFEIKRIKRADAGTGEMVYRIDGRNISYRDHIDLNWQTGTLETTANLDTTQRVLAAVIQDLMKDTKPAQAPSDLN